MNPVPVASIAGEDYNLRSKVELYLSCRNLVNMDTFSKSDPFIVVYMRDGGQRQWTEIARTETIDDNLNPDFTKQIVLDFYFEQVQELLFKVYDSDSNSTDLSAHDFIGSTSTTLAKIMGSNGAAYSANLYLDGNTTTPRGKLFIRGEEIRACQDVLHFNLSASDLEKTKWFGLSSPSPFVSFFRCREDNTYVKVWQSEVASKSQSPNWRKACVPIQILCNGDLDRPLKIEVSDWNSNGSHTCMGSVITSVSALTNGKKLELQNQKGKSSGILNFTNVNLERRFTLLEFVRGGCEINLIIAVDFTASNGAPSTSNSLHYQNPQAGLFGSSRNLSLLNEYQKAMLSIGEILQDYDADNLFPLYGFGGAVNGKTNHCFPLNFSPDSPEVHGLEEVMQTYSRAFQYVSLSGPTLFGPVLDMANRIAEEHHSEMKRLGPQAKQNYTVLLILTDGVINDFDAAKEQIIRGSNLPLSIVIVGVGSADFSNMEILDADDTPLQYRGKTMARDIVQFVPFRNFANSSYTILAKETLAEIPEQLTSYFASCGIKPKPPTLASSRHFNLEQSQRILSGEAPDNIPFASAVPLSNPPPTAPPPVNL